MTPYLGFVLGRTTVSGGVVNPNLCNVTSLYIPNNVTPKVIQVRGMTTSEPTQPTTKNYMNKGLKYYQTLILNHE